MKKIFLAFVSLFLVGAVWATMLDEPGTSSLEGTAFDTSEGEQQSEPLDLQSSGSFTAESYNRMVELVSSRDGVSNPPGRSSLWENNAINPGTPAKQSSPLTLKNPGDLLTAEEYNRLLEALADNDSAKIALMTKEDGDSELNGTAYDPDSSTTYQSAQLSLEDTGNDFSHAEYNRLLEVLAPTTGPWTTGSWSSCSASCGGGTRTRSVTCTYDTCTGSEPSSSQSCNTQSCGGGGSPSCNPNGTLQSGWTPPSAYGGSHNCWTDYDTQSGSCNMALLSAAMSHCGAGCSSLSYEYSELTGFLNISCTP